MFKLAAIVSLLLIATWSHADSKRHKKEATASVDFDPGSSLWASALSCDSCGSECASACGTRHFRSCCFNYLRRKRGPGPVKFWPKSPWETRSPARDRPIYMFEDLPEVPEPILNEIFATDLKAIDFPNNRDLERRIHALDA